MKKRQYFTPLNEMEKIKVLIEYGLNGDGLAATAINLKLNYSPVYQFLKSQNVVRIRGRVEGVKTKPLKEEERWKCKK